MIKGSGVQSDVITSGSCSDFSHAILVEYDGFCMEAVKPKVRRTQLTYALEHATHGVLFRHNNMHGSFGDIICSYAKSFEGRPYDMRGAIRSGVSSGCKPITRSSFGRMTQLSDEIWKLGFHSRSLFCSELVALVYQMAGLSATDYKPEQVTPGALASSPYLSAIKEVVKV